MAYNAMACLVFFLFNDFGRYQQGAAEYDDSDRDQRIDRKVDREICYRKIGGRKDNDDRKQ